MKEKNRSQMNRMVMVNAKRRDLAASCFAAVAALLVPVAPAAYLGEPKPTVAEVQYPERVFTNSAGRLCVDFGKAAFGWLEIDAPAAGLDYFLTMGEHLQNDGTVNRNPPACVRCVGAKWRTEKKGFQRVPMPPDLRNLFAAKEGNPIEIPKKFGVVLPFRAVEIYSSEFPVTAATIRRQVVTYPADRNESSFSCDDARLTAVWDFCKYSMFATSFAGQFVDGDRERIPYEADTYVSQLSWYAISSDYAYPRRSIEHLYAHPTWPTEFKIISVMSAWADWMWTGDISSVKRHYDLLKGRLLLSYRRADGLLVSGGERAVHPSMVNRLGLADIVDWPPSERDGFDFRDVNAVVNAFHYRGLVAMAELAEAIGRKEEADSLKKMAQATAEAFQKVFFDGATGLYRDGEGSSHSSLHANAVALAFGLVPEDHVGKIADWLVSRGMACSVYFSQYLLEALYRTGRADAALRLLTAENDRSWIGMMRQGATITMEAWNRRVKPNLDWNHAWGTTAINAISRFLLGVRPLEPGFRRLLIAPQIGNLKKVSAVVPTMKGAVRISIADGVLSVDTPVSAVIEWKGQRREVSAGHHDL